MPRKSATYTICIIIPPAQCDDTITETQVFNTVNYFTVRNMRQSIICHVLKLPEAHDSLWKTTAPSTPYQPLRVDLGTDVVIVGGGITGLTCAYLLKQAGQKVIVLEKNRLASGTTGGTTGKVTSQHGLTYANLVKSAGESHAKLYGQANEVALDEIEKIIKKEKINCEWQRSDNYVFTADPNQVQTFKEEAEIAAKLGLPASFEATSDLPFPVAGAVKFARQAKMHTARYVHGLATAIHGNGSYVFENSNVTSFQDGTQVKVKTKRATVTAKNLIVATKMPAFPLLARYTCALQEYPQTSYIVAGKYNEGLNGMYISPDKDHYSILPVHVDGESLLLIGGQNHIPGLGRPEKRYQKLATYAERHFGITDITYQWKAMDYLAYDNIPLIGKVYPWSKHMYMASAYRKWGLSSSMVAGTILRDIILGQSNKWTGVFDSMRLKPLISLPKAAIKELLN